MGERIQQLDRTEQSMCGGACECACREDPSEEHDEP